MKTTVIHHSADFDGLFCREIARKFLPDAELIGWDFGDKPLTIPDGTIYVMDLPVDRVFGFQWLFREDGQKVLKLEKGCDVTMLYSSNPGGFLDRVIWIDHHASSIASHAPTLAGYRIDGVAACRLAWQWFAYAHGQMSSNGIVTSAMGEWPPPKKQEFIDRSVSEPWAVRLAGEYDIWCKLDPNAELFQHGLRSEELFPVTWDCLLSSDIEKEATVTRLLNQGRAIQYAKTQENAGIITSYGFTIQFEGLTFLACNHARFNSHLFTAGIKPEHDALLGFNWSGTDWRVSLYHAPGHEQHDLSKIAVKYGGGGHRGAAGFRAMTLPFLPK